MPITADYKSPDEKVFEPLKPDYYTVKIMDIEGEVKPNKFKDDDGNPQPDVHQFKIVLETVDKEPGRKLTVWVKDSLIISKKAKLPDVQLPVLLKAVTGREFGVGDRTQVTPDFLNSLIGSELRVATGLKKTADGKEFSSVLGFFAK